MVSNTYCVVFLLCFSSFCVPYVASFSGLSIFDSPSVFSNVCLFTTFDFSDLDNKDQIKKKTQNYTNIVSVKSMKSKLGQLTSYQIDRINEQVHVVLKNVLSIYVLQTHIHLSYLFYRT